MTFAFFWAACGAVNAIALGVYAEGEQFSGYDRWWKGPVTFAFAVVLWPACLALVWRNRT